MSGTSLDGLDLCYAKFQKNDVWNFEILKAETVSYPEEWEDRLRHSIHVSSQELMQLHSDYGFFLGEKVMEFIQKNHISNVDVIASHGHTVFHQPDKKFTTQIGDGRAIKEITKIPVVYDFRTLDVLKGGNGAPLVPIGDQYLFSEYDACVNIGGFSNISLQKNGKRIAFDICPVNIVLNRYAKQLGKKYDENGEIARVHHPDQKTIERLNALNYYQQLPPKSLGIEWVNDFFISELNALSPEKILSTCTEHFAFQISKILNEFHLKKVLFSGGGAYNSYLMERIKSLTNSETMIANPMITEFKEALIFAFMGILRMKNEINVLASATGASEDHCSGLLV